MDRKGRLNKEVKDLITLLYYDPETAGRKHRSICAEPQVVHPALHAIVDTHFDQTIGNTLKCEGVDWSQVVRRISVGDGRVVADTVVDHEEARCDLPAMAARRKYRVLHNIVMYEQDPAREPVGYVAATCDQAVQTDENVDDGHGVSHAGVNTEVEWRSEPTAMVGDAGSDQNVCSDSDAEGAGVQSDDDSCCGANRDVKKTGVTPGGAAPAMAVVAECGSDEETDIPADDLQVKWPSSCYFT